MSYRVTVNGVTIECDGVMEALALTARLGSQKAASANGKSAQRPISQKAETSRKPEETQAVTVTKTAGARPRETAQKAIKFLTAVASADAKGVGGEQMVKAVGAASYSALGTFRQQMEVLLLTLSFELSEVAIHKRIKDARCWFPGPRLKEAISALKKEAS